MVTSRPRILVSLLKFQRNCPFHTGLALQYRSCTAARLL